MLHLPAIYRRSALAKALGLAVGLLTFFLIPMLFGDGHAMLRWGLLGWYITLGGLIGVIGFVDRIPVFDLRFPPLIRGAYLGAWMNLLAVLLAHDELRALTAGFWGLPDSLTSPWWFIVDGMVIGAAIDLIVSRAVGPVAMPREAPGPA